MSSPGFNTVSFFRCFAGQQMEIGEGDGPFPVWPFYSNVGIERGHGDAHIAGMGGDTMIAAAQDGMGAVVPVDGGNTPNGPPVCYRGNSMSKK